MAGSDVFCGQHHDCTKGREKRKAGMMARLRNCEHKRKAVEEADSDGKMVSVRMQYGEAKDIVTVKGRRWKEGTDQKEQCSMQTGGWGMLGMKG